MQNVLAERAAVRLRRPARLLRLASDERLVALVRSGDEAAFEALYDRHHPAILGFCRHMLGTREEAEDAVQHTFLSAFRDLGRSEKPIELRPWLFAIARNRCLSLLRARRTHVEIDAAEPATDGLTATVERREDLRELLDDLAHLPEDQRAALLLAELGALDHAGIATVLGCPREKVKALVFQARTSLAASREARATPCEEIRLELATASGAALRRGPLRRHLRICAGCRAFKAEVATQRKLLALALPVVPSLALKASVLTGGGGASASGGGGAAGVAAATGATSSTGNGVLGGLLGTVTSTGAGKAAVTLAIAGAVAGGGALTQRLEHHRDGTRASSASVHRGAPPHVSDASRAAPPQGSALSRIHRPDDAARHDTARTPVPASSTHGAGNSAFPHGARPADAPPGHGGTPPGQAKTPPRHGSVPPGQAKTPPGQGGTPPGQAKTPSRHGGAPPGHDSAPPATEPNAGTLPGLAGAAPGTSGGAPGQSGASDGDGG